MAQEQKEFSGFYAHRVRAKVVKAPASRKGFYALRVQHGFSKKVGDKRHWTNRFYSVMVNGDTNCDREKFKALDKGDYIFVSGRMVEEEWEYQGSTKEDRIIWADSVEIPETQPQTRGGGGQDGYPPGMDDVPF